jgi:hypothetical protein
MGNFTTSLGIVWTPPSAAANSGNSNIAIQGTENAQSVGKVDVGSGTIIGTVFVIPLSGISAAKVCVIQNQMSSEIGVRLNGNVTDNFRLAPGQTFCLFGPSAPGTTPLTSVSVVTTAAPSQVETINYWALGD